MVRNLDFGANALGKGEVDSSILSGSTRKLSVIAAPSRFGLCWSGTRSPRGRGPCCLLLACSTPSICVEVSGGIWRSAVERLIMRPA
jgi:hypothetical protein